MSDDRIEYHTSTHEIDALYAAYKLSQAQAPRLSQEEMGYILRQTTSIASPIGALQVLGWYGYQVMYMGEEHYQILQGDEVIADAHSGIQLHEVMKKQIVREREIELEAVRKVRETDEL